jgi:hypothetical protein
VDPGSATSVDVHQFLQDCFEGNLSDISNESNEPAATIDTLGHPGTSYDDTEDLDGKPLPLDINV